jgi:D-serine deaminase-like pyridoxal phosphate-dependent protein
VVTVTFSEPITAGVGYSNISVVNSNGSIPTIYTSISGNILTITRSGTYYPGDTYILNIPANAVQDSVGNNLFSSYTGNFTIGSDPLTINSTNPVNGATNIPVNTTITVTFSEPITAGVGYSNISVVNSNGSIPTIYTSISGNILTITRSGTYYSGCTYILNIPANAVQDSAGNNLVADYTSSFTIVTT